MSNPGLVFALSPRWGSYGKSNLFLFVGKPIFYLWTNLFDFQFLVNRIYLEIPLFFLWEKTVLEGSWEVGEGDRKSKKIIFVFAPLLVCFFLSRLLMQINVLKDTVWHPFLRELEGILGGVIVNQMKTIVK